MTSTVKSVRSESDEKFERETPSVATFSQGRYRRRRNRWAGSRCEPRFDRTGRRVGRAAGVALGHRHHPLTTPNSTTGTQLPSKQKQPISAPSMGPG